jgi:hypothetical protein
VSVNLVKLQRLGPGWGKGCCRNGERLSVELVVIIDLDCSSTILSLASVLAPIPPILDSIVTSSVKSTGDLSPSLPQVIHKFLNDKAFLVGDGTVVQ